MSSPAGRLALLLLSLLLPSLLALVVTYDSRSFRLDGDAKLLLSGSFHYPRSSASEWHGIMSKMKAQGMNTLQTYVFWDIHEQEEGAFKFTTGDGLHPEEDIIAFLETAKEVGLCK